MGPVAQNTGDVLIRHAPCREHRVDSLRVLFGLSRDITNSAVCCLCCIFNSHGAWFEQPIVTSSHITVTQSNCTTGDDRNRTDNSCCDCCDSRSCSRHSSAQCAGNSRTGSCEETNHSLCRCNESSDDRGIQRLSRCHDRHHDRLEPVEEHSQRSSLCRSRSCGSSSSSGRSLTSTALALTALNTATQQTTVAGLSTTRTHHIGTVRACVSSCVHGLIRLNRWFNTGILTLRELFNPLWFHTYLLFVYLLIEPVHT